MGQIELLEWKKYKKHNDSQSELCPGYILDSSSRFIMEPSFYTQLKNLESIYPDFFVKVVDAINKIVKKNKKVFFTLDASNPFSDVPGYIYLEMTDILNKLKILIEDKSRGSDYGD